VRVLQLRKISKWRLKKCSTLSTLFENVEHFLLQFNQTTTLFLPSIANKPRIGPMARNANKYSELTTAVSMPKS
jgi:hypothetical protein